MPLSSITKANSRIYKKKKTSPAITKNINIINPIIAKVSLYLDQLINQFNGITRTIIPTTQSITKFLNNVLLPLARFKPIVASSKNKSVK